MKRDMWILMVFCLLMGWTAQLHAQQPVWRSVASPTTGRQEQSAEDAAGAALGKPVAESQQAAGQIIAVSYKEAAPSGKTPSQEKSSIPWPDQEESEVTDFATERALGVPKAVLPVSAASGASDLSLSGPGGSPGGGVFRDSPIQQNETAPMPTLTSPSDGAGPDGGPVSSADPNGVMMEGDGAENLCMGMDYVNSGFGSTPYVGPRHFYLFGEYLLWWLSSQHVPPLATTSAPADEGFLGKPSTQVLFGGNSLGNGGVFSGGRFRAGYWFDPCMTNGAEVSYFFLGTRSVHYLASSSQYPVIGRPFFDLNSNMESAELTAFPGAATGNLVINAPTHLWGAEANWRHRLCCGCNYRFDGLAGFRFLNLSDGLSITENVQTSAALPAPFTSQTITVNDTFNTSNQFYGGQVGVGGWYYFGRLSVNLRAMVALGDTVQHLGISGFQHFVGADGTVQNFQGGLLAEPSNIGHFTKNAFSVVPEATINLGYNVTQHIRTYVGYNFLYWSNVIRAGEQIDRNLDVTQIPNFSQPGATPLAGQHPGVPLRETGFWAQGIVFGVQFLY